jgi:hypothetical protein
MLLALVVATRVAGWVVSALVVWAAWTHRVSAIRGWLLSTIVVAAAIFFFLLGILLPTLVAGFLHPLPIGLLAAAVVTLATTQWLQGVALAIGAVLARAVRSGALAVQKHTGLNERGRIDPPDAPA